MKKTRRTNVEVLFMFHRYDGESDSSKEKKKRFYFEIKVQMSRMKYLQEKRQQLSFKTNVEIVNPAELLKPTVLGPFVICEVSGCT